MTSETDPRPTPEQDAELRSRLREGLAQAQSDHLDALQARALAQWRQRSESPSLRPHGLVGVLPIYGRQHSAVFGGALVALGLAVLLVAKPWVSSDPALDELLQPDVLSLLAEGEL